MNEKMSNLIVYINMFVLYAGLNFVGPYMSSYFEYYGKASSTDIGKVELINCSFSAFVGIIVSTLADRHRAHQLVFLITLFFGFLGFGSLLIPALMIEQPGEPEQTKFWFYFISLCIIVGGVSLKTNLSLASSFAANLAAKTNKTFGSIRFYGSLGLVTSSIIMIYMKDIKRFGFLVPPIFIYVCNSIIHWLLIAFWPDKRAFILGEEVKIENIHFNTIEFKFVDKYLFRKRTILNCANDFNMLLQGSGSDHDETNQMKKPLLLSANTSSYFDQSFGEKYPKQQANNNYSLSTSETYNHGSIELLNNERSIKSYDDDDDDDLVSLNKKRKPIEFSVYFRVIKMIASKNKFALRYLIIIILNGSIGVTNWNYFFPYLKTIYKDEFQSVTSYILFGKTISESIFYFISPSITKRLSQSTCISISMFFNILRYLCYILHSNFKMTPMYVVLIETLCAPIGGLFFCAMNEIAMEFALEAHKCVPKLIEKGLISNDEETINRINNGFKATFVTIFARCYDGVGFAIGSIPGGWIADYYGYHSLWLTNATIACACFLLNVLFQLKNYLIDNNKTINNDDDDKLHASNKHQNETHSSTSYESTSSNI